MSLLFIEATRFTERVQQLRAEGELWKLEDELCRDPEAGDVIRGTSGFRKVRMRLPGRGKRGGCRVIYFYVGSAARIYFVYLYPKNEEVDLSADQKKALRCIGRKIYEDIRKDPSAHR